MARWEAVGVLIGLEAVLRANVAAARPGEGLQSRGEVCPSQQGACVLYVLALWALCPQGTSGRRCRAHTRFGGVALTETSSSEGAVARPCWRILGACRKERKADAYFTIVFTLEQSLGSGERPDECHLVPRIGGGEP